MVTFKKIKQTVTGKLLVEGECASADSKPIDIIANGSKLFEIDTGSWYFFNEGAQEWVKSVRGGTGNVAVDDLTVTENGTYTPEDEQHAFGTVVVDVPPPEGYISPNGYNNYDLISVQQTGNAKQFANANSNYKIHTTGNANDIFAPFSAGEVYAMLEAGASVNAEFVMGDAVGTSAGYVERNSSNYTIYFQCAQFYLEDLDGVETIILNASFAITYAVSANSINVGNAFLYTDGVGSMDVLAMLSVIDTSIEITVPYLDGRGLPSYIKRYSDQQSVSYHYTEAGGVDQVYDNDLANIISATDIAISDCRPHYTFNYWSTVDGIRVDDVRDLIGTSYTYDASGTTELYAVYDESEPEPEEP